MTRPSAGSPSAMQSPTVPRQEPVGHPPPPGGGPVLHRPARPALAAAPREQRAGRLRRWLLSLSGVLACLGLWHLATLGNSRTDISGPLLVAEGLRELLAQGVLQKNVVASLFRVAWGFVLAATAGIPLGILLGRSAGANSALDPVVQILRPISPIAWLPISTLLFGGVTFFDPADVSSIFLIFLAAFFPIVTATRAAVRAIDPRYLRSAQNFGVEGMELVRLVILPAALPQILTGLRLALGIAWVVVVAAEMLGVQSGLGFQVNDARNNLRYDLVIAAMVKIGIIGLLLDRLMTAVETAVLRRRGIVRR